MSGVRTVDPVEVEGGSLWRETAGTGCDVVLLHGFSFDASTWDLQFDDLSRDFRVTRYDLRGFGRSSLPTGSYSHIDDLLRVLDDIGAKAAHVIGLSLGANVALGLALAHPDRVRSLVLASAGLPGHPWSETRPPDAALAHAKAHGVESARAYWLAHPLFASADARPEVSAALHAVVGRYSGWHWANENPMRALEATRERLPEVSTPTLVVSGDHDVGGYRAIAGVLSEGIRGARLLRLPDAGHLLTMEEPQRFNEAVKAFIHAVDAT